MTTMNMESQRLMLAREILNTDNNELLEEMSKAYHRIKTRLAKVTAAEQAAEEDSKETILKELKEAILEFNEYKAGRVKARSAWELLEELKEEEELLKLVKE